MVKKIKKKTKKGPRAPYAALLVIALTVLYGPQRRGRDFRRTLEDPAKLRAALELQFGPDLIPADRPLSVEEFRGWALSSSPGRLAGMFARGGRIPMGPAPGESPGEGSPFLGLLPVLAIRRGQDLDRFFHSLGKELTEIPRVAFQNALGPSLNQIPGYDQILYAPLCPVRNLDQAIAYLNTITEEAFHQAGRTRPDRFAPLEDPGITAYPSFEPLMS